VRDVPVEVPGGQINVWHRPAENGRSTALLVHGLTGTSRWWSRVIDRLPVEIGLIAVDARGRGASVASPPPFDLETLADDLTRCLDHFGVGRAIAAGYSMGAWIVAIFAERHPDRVERLVLVDGGLPMSQDPGDHEQFISSMVGPALARLELDFANEEAFFDFWRAHPALKSHWDDAMKPALVYELAASNERLEVRANPEAVREGARQITLDPRTNPAARRVPVPAHLIVVERGTADQKGGLIPLWVAEAASAGNPSLTVQYLRGLNHYTLMLGDGAATVASAIVGR
jgi:pimeloyl-ACP methyl ester carboxylesterase